MTVSRRSVLAAAGASFASPAITAETDASEFGAQRITDATEVARLIRISEAANGALMRGDIDRYRAMVTLADDFTLMSPFGGKPTRGSEVTDETWRAMQRFFRNGALKQEVVQSYASADMVVLAVIERCHGEVGGLPAQDWPLRVTIVYRRDNTGWRLVHRHADPLVAGITLHQAAALARGEPG